MNASLAVVVLAAGIGMAVAGCRTGAPATDFPVVDAKARVLASRAVACPDRAQEAGAIVFRDDRAWDDHLATLAPPALVADWRPDFEAGESVLLARAGDLPNPGYRVAVEEPNLSIRAGLLQLRLTAIPPPEGSLQAQVITPACLYLRLDRADYRRVAVDLVR